MKKSIVILLHIGFWLSYLFLIIVMLGIYFQESEEIESRILNAFQVILLFVLIPSAISFYLFHLVLFPKYLQKKKYWLSALYGILISLGSAGIGYTLMEFFGPTCEEEDGWNLFMSMILFGGIISLISGIVGLVIKGFITWFEEMKLKEALQQKNHQMEMALVKAQLDPHFLFNTINNIDILILKNANKASNYLNKLSDIMRFMLFETKTEKILLSQEIEYIEKYIELQKIRTANSSYVNFAVSGNAAAKKIAPMAFIPFIENAFKHTTNKKIENAIDINILIEEENIKLICENKFDPNRKSNQESNGLGNDLIEKRLQLMYPEKHRLDISNQNNLYSVFLTINN